MNVQDRRRAAWERVINANKEKIQRRAPLLLSLPPHFFSTEELRIALIPVKRTLLLLLSCVCSNSSCFIAAQSAMTTQVSIDSISPASLIILR